MKQAHATGEQAETRKLNLEQLTQAEQNGGAASGMLGQGNAQSNAVPPAQTSQMSPAQTNANSPAPDPTAGSQNMQGPNENNAQMANPSPGGNPNPPSAPNAPSNGTSANPGGPPH
jgi:hypothetical protein